MTAPESPQSTDPTPSVDPAPQVAGPDYLELDTQLRRLARRLLPGEASADDLVQDGWLSALEHQGEVRDRRAWLSQVLRNTASRRHRRTAQRRHAERESARPEDLPGPEEEHEARATRQLLHASLEALREPYRSVLRMRYLEELPLREIASRLGRSGGTVRSQSLRGLEMLRLLLDRRHGGRRESWLPGVALLAGRDGRERPAPQRDALRSMLPLGLAGAAILALVAWFTAGEREPVEAALAATPEAPASDQRVEGHESATAARELVTATPALASAPAPAATRVLEVQVNRPDGTPCPSATVRIWGAAVLPLLSESADERGFLSLDVPVAAMVGAPRFKQGEAGVLISAHSATEACSFQHDVAIPLEGARVELRTRGPAQFIRGLVVDEAGEAIPDIWVLLYGNRRGHVSSEGRAAGDGHAPTLTDEQGVFRFHHLPKQLHRVLVSAPGYAPLERALEGPEDLLEARFELQRGGAVHGQVRDGTGAPVPGARIWKPDIRRRMMGGGLREVVADDQGRFEFMGLGPGGQSLFACDPRDERLFASLSAIIEADESRSWNPVLVPTEGVTLLIENARGEPVPGAPLTLYSTDDALRWVEVMDTDSDGLAHFVHVPDLPLGTLVMSARRSDASTTTIELEARSGLISVRLPDEQARSVLQALILNEQDQVPMGAAVHGTMRDELFHVPLQPTTGELRVPNLAPGRWQLVLLVPGAGTHALGEHELRPGAEYELGLTRIPAPLEVELEWGPLAPTPEAPWTLRCRLPGRTEDQALRVLTEAVASVALHPGRYQLGPAGSEATTSFEVGEDPGSSRRVAVE